MDWAPPIFAGLVKKIRNGRENRRVRLTNEGNAIRPNDTRGEEVEVVHLLAHDHGVARVVAALERGKKRGKLSR